MRASRVLGIALLVAAGVIAYQHSTTDDPAPMTSDGGGPTHDAPLLRAARGALARPAQLHLHVRTSAGAPPPEGTIVVISTPSSLRAERPDVADRAFTAQDFTGHTLHVPDLGYRIWDIRVVAPGHVGLMRQIALPKAPAAEPFEADVVLDAWASLDVRVLDVRGVPLAGARVSLEGGSVQGASRPVHPDDRPVLTAERRVQTDASGHATHAVLLPLVEAMLHVRHPRHPAFAQKLTLPEPGAQRAIVVTLEAPCAIRGEVDLAAFGVDAAGIVVTDFHHAGRTATFQRRAAVEPDGRFVLHNVRAGRHTVQVTARDGHDRRTALREVEVPRGQTVDLGMVGPDGGVPLHLHVHVEEPVPANALVRCHLTRFPPHDVPADAPADAGRLDRHPLEFVLPAHGACVLEGLGRGTLIVSLALVDPDGAPLDTHRPGKAAVRPEARGEPLDVVLHAVAPPRATHPLHITLRPPPRVMPRDFRWRVFLFDDDDRLIGATPRRPAAGAHRFRALLPPREGGVRVVAVAHGRVSAFVSLDGVGADGAAVELDRWPDAAARVTVTVRDERGRPLAGATVLARMGADEPDATAITATTDPSGRATFDTLPGRALFLRVEGDARVDAEPVRLRADELVGGARLSHDVVVHREP